MKINWSAIGGILVAVFFIYGIFQGGPRHEAGADGCNAAIPGRPCYPQTVRGFPRVIDGDTIAINSVHIRLWGIDTPPSFASDRERGPATQALEQAGYTRPQIIEAGQAARQRLSKLLADHALDCATVGTSYNRIVARCAFHDTPERDVSCEMLKTGLAVEWKEYSRGTLKSCALR